MRSLFFNDIIIIFPSVERDTVLSEDLLVNGTTGRNHIYGFVGVNDYSVDYGGRRERGRIPSPIILSYLCVVVTDPTEACCLFHSSLHLTVMKSMETN